MSDTLITVTIGRNVNDGRGNFGPMPQYRWDEFQNQTRQLLAVLPGTDESDNSSTVFGPFTGTGEWEGVTEESVTFTALTGRAFETDRQEQAWVKAFGQILSSIAHYFGQDAIAWSYGPAMLARS